MPFKVNKLIGGSSEPRKVLHMDERPCVCATHQNTCSHCFLRVLYITEDAEFTMCQDRQWQIVLEKRITERPWDSTSTLRNDLL